MSPTIDLRTGLMMGKRAINLKPKVYSLSTRWLAKTRMGGNTFLCGHRMQFGLYNKFPEGDRRKMHASWRPNHGPLQQTRNVDVRQRVFGSKKKRGNGEQWCAPKLPSLLGNGRTVQTGQWDVSTPPSEALMAQLEWAGTWSLTKLQWPMWPVLRGPHIRRSGVHV